MKILVYGGCHAQVIRDFLLAVLGDDGIQVELLINFELIASNKPFPLEMIDRCDVMLFSPVENKGEYNTKILEEYCRSRGKLSICFPWMEWHGYSPGAVKGHFKARYQWHYASLANIAQGFDDFQSFCNYAVARFPDNDTIDRVFGLTSAHLRDAERRHAMPVRVADFIDDHHRASRLFLLSDHPSQRIYVHVVQQIVDLLGLVPRAAYPTREPQQECRTPIFPRVASRLGLDFEDPEWADDVLAPDQSSTLEDYLRLYFYGDSVVLAPLTHADLVAHTALRSMVVPMDSATRLLASPLGCDVHDGIGQFEYLATLAGPTIALDPRTRFSIDSKLWRDAW